MLQIGITGGIGSGKTTVCKIVESLGFPVYYADERGRYITSHDPLVLQGIKDNFGPSVFVNGKLDRAALGAIVFKDNAKLDILNRLIHPAVKQDYQAWLKEQNSLLVFSEIAILFEMGRYRDFDKIMLVTAPEEARIERVIKRSGLTEADIRVRINNQWTDDKKAELAHYQIDNSNEKELIPQVTELVNTLKELAKKAAQA